jgi:ATP-dependent DNA helicase RecG
MEFLMGESTTAISSVEELGPQLQSGPLNGLKVAPLHGRLSAEEKDATMRAFANKEIDVLVSTTVIEVGVDVPNATVMVIMDADRFGVSQLHQLRGRVGRGTSPGLCLLVTSAAPESSARTRLDAVAATLDGFEKVMCWVLANLVANLIYDFCEFSAMNRLLKQPVKMHLHFSTQACRATHF